MNTPARKLPITLYFLSCLLSYTGGHMLNYSVIIYSQEVLGSDWLSGAGFALCFGPPLLLGWWAGVLCDRISPVRLIHFAQISLLASAAVLLAGETLLNTNTLRTVTVLSAGLLAGIGWSFVAPARMTALAQLVAPQNLPRATLLLNLLVLSGFGLGPICISALRVSFGWVAVFVVAGSLFIISSLLLLPIAGKASHKIHASVLEEVKEGLRAVRASPLLSQLLLAAIFGYIMMGPMQVMLPKFAIQQLGMSEMARGSLLGTLAPSLIAGGVAAMLLARHIPNGAAILIATVLAGLSFLMLGLSHSVAMATCFLVAVGLFGGLAISLMVAGIQTQAQDAVRGRVMAMYTLISQVVPAASGLIGGLMLTQLDVSTAMVVVGACIMLFALCNTAWMRALRHYPGVAR